MTDEETRDFAIGYCECVSCADCLVYLCDLDTRTEEEKTNGQVPCCENIVKLLKGWVEDVQKT